MKRISCGVILLVLAGLTMSAQAIGDQIRFSQVASGAISAVLAGSVDPCSGSNHFPWGPTTTVSLNGNEFDINTFFIILDPRGCPDSGQPYEVTTSLGTVGDGHYTVEWTVVGTFNVRGTFDVRSAVLQLTANTVPALTPPALSILFTMIALAGLALLRRQR
jgi:hypothetical protein